MPWIVRERDGRHCVYKEGDDGEPAGDALACHDTAEEARRHQSALYANEPASKSDLAGDDTLVYVGESVKVLGDGKVGGILVPFGDPSTADAHGDYFTDATDYGLDISTRARVIYHHGFTKAFGRRRLGVVGMGVEPGVGVMAVEPVRLDVADPAQRDIYAKAEAGEMYWSTGTAHHLMARRPNGVAREIVSWPITECSLTPRPANRMARAMALKALIDEGAGDHAPDAGGIAPDASTDTLQAITSGTKSDPPAAPAGDRLLDDLTRAASDAERLRGLCESAYKARQADGGRTLSREKRDAIRSVAEAYAALYDATAPARVDAEEFRALLSRARLALHPARKR